MKVKKLSQEQYKKLDKPFWGRVLFAGSPKDGGYLVYSSDQRYTLIVGKMGLKSIQRKIFLSGFGDIVQVWRLSPHQVQALIPEHQARAVRSLYKLLRQEVLAWVGSKR